MINRDVYNQARRGLGLTHAQVADRVGVTRQSLHRWLAGTHPPTLAHLAALARALNIPIAKLLK